MGPLPTLSKVGVLLSNRQHVDFSMILGKKRELLQKKHSHTIDDLRKMRIFLKKSLSSFREVNHFQSTLLHSTDTGGLVGIPYDGFIQTPIYPHGTYKIGTTVNFYTKT